MTTPMRQIRASYDDATITVYQAYSPQIAEPAVAARRLKESPVRVQWDPERSLRLQPLEHRSLQERPYPLPPHIAAVIGAG